jgi:hypothetical protein
MNERQTALARLYAEVGLKRLSPAWAKAEIFLGLAAVGLGFYFLAFAAAHPDIAQSFLWGGWLFFVFGGYLALAGHRSHIYQSNNLLTAYLAELIRRQSGQTP